jgi:hypothetical protein
MEGHAMNTVLKKGMLMATLGVMLGCSNVAPTQTGTMPEPGAPVAAAPNTTPAQAQDDSQYSVLQDGYGYARRNRALRVCLRQCDRQASYSYRYGRRNVTRCIRTCFRLFGDNRRRDRY